MHFGYTTGGCISPWPVSLSCPPNDWCWAYWDFFKRHTMGLEVEYTFGLKPAEQFLNENQLELFFFLHKTKFRPGSGLGNHPMLYYKWKITYNGR